MDPMELGQSPFSVPTNTRLISYVKKKFMGIIFFSLFSRVWQNSLTGLESAIVTLFRHQSGGVYPPKWVRCPDYRARLKMDELVSLHIFIVTVDNVLTIRCSASGLF